MLEQCSHDEVVLIAFEKSAHLPQEGEYLCVDARLGEGEKDIAEMLLIEILKEIFPDIDKILYILNFDCVLVKKQIETIAPPFLFSQQLYYFS